MRQVDKRIPTRHPSSHVYKSRLKWFGHDNRTSSISSRRLSSLFFPGTHTPQIDHDLAVPSTQNKFGRQRSKFSPPPSPPYISLAPLHDPLTAAQLTLRIIYINRNIIRFRPGKYQYRLCGKVNSKLITTSSILLSPPFTSLLSFSLSPIPLSGAQSIHCRDCAFHGVNKIS